MTAVLSLPVLKMCKHCSEVATAADGCCASHTRSNRNIRSYSSSPRPSSSIKNPIGVELECKNENLRALASVGHVSYDGSVTDGGEIKLVSSSKLVSARVADIVQRARLAGCYVDRQCGFHVHLSLPRGLDMELPQYEKLFDFALSIQDFMFKLMPPSRKANSYCRRFENVGDVYYKRSYLMNHYQWITLSNKYPTVEIRLHGGTMNPWKAKAWVEACLVLQSAIHSVLLEEESDIVDRLSSGDDEKTMSAFKKSPLAYRYIQARYNNNGVLKDFGFKG